MRKLKFITIILAVGIFSGCATVPTEEQVVNADYGDYPNNYQEIVKDHYSRTLFDPYSAHYRWVKEPYRGYFVQFGKFEFGYIVRVGINAKNRMGGYVGEQEEDVLIKDGKVVEAMPVWTTP